MVAALAAVDVRLGPPPGGDVDQDAEQAGDVARGVRLAGAAHDDVAHGAVRPQEAGLEREVLGAGDRVVDDGDQPVAVVGVIELGEDREMRRRRRRVAPGDLVEPRRPDRLPRREGDAPVADAGELLGHGQQVVGAGLRGRAFRDFARLQLQLRLVRAAQSHLALERRVRLREAQVRDDDIGEVAQGDAVFLRERAQARIDEAEGADPDPRREAQGRAGIEPDVARGTVDERAVAEARVEPGVRHDMHRIPLDRVVAEALLTGKIARDRRARRLQPLPVGVDEPDEGRLDAEQPPGRAAHRLEMRLLRRIHDREGVQGRDPACLERFRVAHDRASPADVPPGNRLLSSSSIQPGPGRPCSRGAAQRRRAASNAHTMPSIM